MHNFSVWRDISVVDGVRVGGLWAKCKCGWSGWARTHEDLAVLCEDHREEQQRLAEIEAEEDQHA